MISSQTLISLEETYQLKSLLNKAQRLRNQRQERLKRKIEEKDFKVMSKKNIIVMSQPNSLEQTHPQLKKLDEIK